MTSSGFFKTCIAGTEGRMQVTGFSMAGEIIGLDGAARDRHTCDAIALEDAEVCVMPFDKISGLSRDVPTLQRHVHEITITSGEGAQHDIVFDGVDGARSAMFDGKTAAPTKLSFKLTKNGKFTYYCSVPGHRQIGMEGTLEVTGPADASAAVPAAKPATAVLGAAPANVIAPASTKAVSISIDHDGTTFTYWTFAKKVPGPMLRVKEGDTVEVPLTNNKNSKAVHSIDLHSATGGLGGGEHTQVAPGETKTMTFKALNPGLYVYHCATPSVDC